MIRANTKVAAYLIDDARYAVTTEQGEWRGGMMRERAFAFARQREADWRSVGRSSASRVWWLDYEIPRSEWSA